MALTGNIVMKEDLDPLTQVNWTKPIPLVSATFHAETFWPGKLGQEVSVTPEKWGKRVKMLLLPNGSIRIKWIADGSEYTVGVANIKGCVHCTD